MLHSGVPECSQLTFNTLLCILPCEIVNRILWYCIALQEIVVANPASDSESLVTYACSTDNFAESRPPFLWTEYWHFRHLSWLSVSLNVYTPFSSRLTDISGCESLQISR
jgi:hypothetical protein